MKIELEKLYEICELLGIDTLDCGDDGCAILNHSELKKRIIQFLEEGVNE